MSQKLHRLSEINQKQRTAICLVCGPVRVSRTGRYWRCVTARDGLYRRTYTPRPKRTPSPKKPGSQAPARTHQQKLHARARKVIVPKQLGRCAICDDACELVIDHCHFTGVIRGALCNECNSGLGFFKDDAELLRRAITYLTRDPQWRHLGRSIAPPSRVHRSAT